MSTDKKNLIGSPPQVERQELEEVVTPQVLKAIVSGYKAGMKVVNLDAKPGSNVGDNYMSIMYALDIQLECEKSGELERLQCMLKTIPRNPSRAGMITDMGVFKKEATIYQQVFPMLVETQKEAGIPAKELHAPWPICYDVHVDGTTDYLAMENLKAQGYKMGNRAIGLDYNHCAVVLRNLARLHAISFVKFGGNKEKLLEAFPTLAPHKFSDISKDSKTSQMHQQFVSASFKSQAEKLRAAGEELVASRLEKMAAMNLHKVTTQLSEQKDNPAVVITHGDCWVNNILFKYEDELDAKCEMPVEVKFVDFQLSQASSRLLDVYYFIMTSARLDVLVEREEDLLLCYYSEFTSFAERMGVDTRKKGLTWEKFLEEGINNKFHGVFMSILLAPMMGADSGDIPDLETLPDAEESEGQGREEYRKKFFENMSKGNSQKKVAIICKDHLPECPQGAEFL